MPHVHAIDRTVHKTYAWLNDVADEFGTDDQEFAYRVVRAWLHTVRDRLPVMDAAHLGAQLPELLRGVYYDGWDPAGKPDKFDRDEYITRFAGGANIARKDVDEASRVVSTVVARHITGELPAILERFPADVRELVRPG